MNRLYGVLVRILICDDNVDSANTWAALLDSDTLSELSRGNSAARLRACARGAAAGAAMAATSATTQTDTGQLRTRSAEF